MVGAAVEESARVINASSFTFHELNKLTNRSVFTSLSPTIPHSITMLNLDHTPFDDIKLQEGILLITY